jgi:hypothetical protein
LVKLNIPKLASVRLAVVMLGDRLGVAAIELDRVETFTIEAENPAAALRAELDARSLAARTVAIGLSRSTVTVKPIELPAVAGGRGHGSSARAPSADSGRRRCLRFAHATGCQLTPCRSRAALLIAAADRRLIDRAARPTKRSCGRYRSPCLARSACGDGSPSARDVATPCRRHGRAAPAAPRDGRVQPELHRHR